MDPLMVFGPQGMALALMLMAATQVLKETFGLTGRKATVLAIFLGCLLGVFGLRQTAARILPDAPVIVGALILGAFLGVIAAGSYKLVGWVQRNGAQLRAETTPVPQVQVAVDPVLPAPAPACPDVPDAAPSGGEIRALPDLLPAVPPVIAAGADPTGGEIEALPDLPTPAPAPGFGFAALPADDDLPDDPDGPVTHPSSTMRE